jgi:hypothetical protein
MLIFAGPRNSMQLGCKRQHRSVREVLQSDAECGRSGVPRSQAEPEPAAAKSADALRPHRAEPVTVACLIGLACPCSSRRCSPPNS